MAEISAQWIDTTAPRTEQPQGGGAPTAAASRALRSVDPLGVPYEDPAPPGYGFPSRPVIDHIHNRARGGHPTDPANLDTKTWEANSRKAGFEGNYARDLERYIQMGLPPDQALEVLRPEADYIETDVHASPVDPAALDTLPSQPQEEEETDD